MPGPTNTKPTKGAALHIDSLTVSYDQTPVLNRIDLDVEMGRIVGIIGPNGAGKSTLIKSIMGLIPRDTGRVLVLGSALKKVRRRVVYVPQRSSVDWDFPVTVRDVVAMGCFAQKPWWSRLKRSDQEGIHRAMDQMGISDLEKRPIANLSGGQQQRVFLARALLQDGDLYFMDEPLVGVDAATESAILEALRDLRDKGKTVVIVNHDLNTAQRYFDDILLLNKKVVAFGTTKETFTPELLQETYGGRLAFFEKDGEQVLLGE